MDVRKKSSTGRNAYVLAPVFFQADSELDKLYQTIRSLSNDSPVKETAEAVYHQIVKSKHNGSLLVDINNCAYYTNKLLTESSVRGGFGSEEYKSVVNTLGIFWPIDENNMKYERKYAYGFSAVLIIGGILAAILVPGCVGAGICMAVLGAIMVIAATGSYFSDKAKACDRRALFDSMYTLANVVKEDEDKKKQAEKKKAEKNVDAECLSNLRAAGINDEEAGEIDDEEAIMLLSNA